MERDADEGKLALTTNELWGYPINFLPYLVRLPNGQIGMTPESCVNEPELFAIYERWERLAKPDGSHIPDPRLLAWSGWSQLPEEFKPFFGIDPVLGDPTVRFNPATEYEDAMVSKTWNWKWERRLTLIRGAHAAEGAPLQTLAQIDRAELIEAFEYAVEFFHKGGDWGDEAAFAQFAIRQGLRTGHLYLMGAYALGETGAYGEASDLLVQGEDLLFGDGAFHYNLACYACLLGDLEMTEARLKRALQLDETFMSKAVDDPHLESLWPTLCEKWIG